MKHIILVVLFTTLVLQFASDSFAQQKKAVKSNTESSEKDRATKQRGGESTDNGDVAWETLSPADSGFSVEIPGKPIHKSSVVKPAPDVDLTLEMYLVNLLNGEIAFVVGYHDLKEVPGTEEKRKEILDGGVKGTLINVSGKITNHKRIQVDGNPARQFSYSGTRGKNSVKGTSRIVLVDRRVYQMTVIKLATTKFDEKIAEKFFSSFSTKK